MCTHFTLSESAVCMNLRRSPLKQKNPHIPETCLHLPWQHLHIASSPSQFASYLGLAQVLTPAAPKTLTEDRRTIEKEDVLSTDTMLQQKKIILDFLNNQREQVHTMFLSVIFVPHPDKFLNQKCCSYFHVSSLWAEHDQCWSIISTCTDSLPVS